MDGIECGLQWIGRYGTELSSGTTTPEKRILLTNRSVSRDGATAISSPRRANGVNHRLQSAVADRGFERWGVQVVKLVRTQTLWRGMGEKTTLQGVGCGARPRRSEMVHSVAKVAVVMPSFEAQLQNVSAHSGRQTDGEQQRQGKHR